MAVYIIGYDLKEGEDYSDLIKEIKSLGSWWHHLDSTWLLDTELPLGDVNDKVLAKLPETHDSLLVMEVSSNYTGNLTNRAWEWIEKHLG